jgi:methylphosphotriester-DNA--protein-cysteine methyltransferase
MTFGLSSPAVRCRARASRAKNQARTELRRLAEISHNLTLDPTLTIAELGMELGLSNNVITQAIRRHKDMTFNEFKRHLHGVVVAESAVKAQAE